MRKINIFALSLLTFTLFSCGKPVEENPDQIIEEEYSISFDRSDYYEIECSLTKAREGEEVNFKINLKTETKIVSSVTVYGEECTKTADFSYKFIMKKEDAHVLVILEDEKVSYPDLKTVMSKVASKRNYTYIINDEIFKTTLTYYYTESAYYVSYSKDQSQYGLAQDLNKDVFEFTLGENEVIPGEAYKGRDGNVINGLWENAIISFADLNINNLTDVVSEDNIYLIEDGQNKTILAYLAGYGDYYALEFVTVKVEVTGDSSFKTIVHFEPENPDYVGDAICQIYDIDSTEIPYIEEYILSGGGAKVDESLAIIEDTLKKIKALKNYTIKVSKNDVPTFVDTFTESYFYSKNLSNDSSSKGHIVLKNAIYNYQIKNNVVVKGNEITYSSSDHADLWANSSSSFKNFSNISLNNITFQLGEDGKYFVNGDDQYSFMSTIYYLVHSGEAFPSINTTQDKVVINDFDDNHISLSYFKNDGNVYTLLVDTFSTSKIDEVDEFITSFDSFDENDLSKLQEVFANLKDSKNYSLSFTNTFGSFATYKKNKYEISYKEDEYILTCTNDETLSYSYKVEDGKVVKYTKDADKNDVKEETSYSSLWEDKVFPSFKDYEESMLVGKIHIDGTYEIISSDFVKFIGSLVYITTSDFSNDFTKVAISLKETEKEVTLTSQSNRNGGFTLVIKY